MNEISLFVKLKINYFQLPVYALETLKEITELKHLRKLKHRYLPQCDSEKVLGTVVNRKCYFYE